MSSTFAATLPRLAEPARRLPLLAALAFSGIVIGVGAALSPLLALAAVVGIGFTAVALTNLPAGLAFFVVLTFFEGLPISGGVTLVKGAGLVLAVAWFAALAGRRGELPVLFRDHPLLGYAIVFFITWSLASMLWAEDAYSARLNTFRLALNAILLLIAYSAISKRQHLIWVLWAYLGGALISAVVGLGGASSAEQFGPYSDPSRLSGGIGDPNELAALLVPAVTLAAFLISPTRGPVKRWLLLMLIFVFALTLFFTQSRGGLVALALVLLVTPFLAGPVRLKALVLILAVAALGIGYYSLFAPPQALHHVTHFSAASATGRQDVWTVSIEMFKDHPFAGIGTGNFQVIVPRYATRNLDLPRADLVVTTPKVAHNTYLHVLTELGIVGFAAFAGIILGALGLAWQAIRLLSQRGERRLEIIARGVLVGTLGMLAAFIFITAQYEKQLWLLLGVCAALSTLARAGESAEG